MASKLSTLLGALALTMTAMSQARAYDCSEKTYQHARANIIFAFGTGILQNDPGDGFRFS